MPPFALNAFLHGRCKHYVPSGFAVLMLNGFLVEQESGTQGIMGITWMASFGQGASLHLATINTSTRLIAGGTCAISAQVTYTS